MVEGSRSMSQPEQNLKNHARTDPIYHFVLAIIFFLNPIFCVVNFFHAKSWFNGWLIVVAIGLILLVFKTRLYPLKVQDRAIRLEERLRLTQLLAEPLRARITELSESQLIGLRFASDEELPVLAAQALNEHLTSKQIKQRIVHWRPDHFRV
jgi:hypothetical protein